MSQAYLKPISDFNGGCHIDSFELELIAHPDIIPQLVGITSLSGFIMVEFKANLDPAGEAGLDAVVAAHTPPLADGTVT